MTLTDEQVERLRGLLVAVRDANGDMPVGVLPSKPGPGGRLRWAKAEAELFAAILADALGCDCGVCSDCDDSDPGVRR